MVASGVLLLVLEVAALMREGDEVGEDHPTYADVEEGLDGASLDVLLDVAVDGLIGSLLHVVPFQLGLQVSRELANPEALDLVVESSHRHWELRENTKTTKTEETLIPDFFFCPLSLDFSGFYRKKYI